MTRFWLFFFSTNNLLGMAAACLGPILLMAGIIGPGWQVVTLLAYVVGWVTGKVFFPDAAIEQKRELSLDDLQRVLETILKEHAKALPDEARASLQSIYQSLEAALPRFKELFEKSGTGGQEWIVFRQVILSYLPETVNNYLRLPAAYAAMHKVGNTGKTPKVLLIEQLSVMDTELQSAVRSLFESDAQKMLINSKFLESKFTKALDFT